MSTKMTIREIVLELQQMLLTVVESNTNLHKTCQQLNEDVAELHDRLVALEDFMRSRPLIPTPDDFYDT